MTLALRYLAHSEIGLVRKNNQDSAYVSPHLLAVADGMGGAAAGDLASAIVVDRLADADAHRPEADGMLPALDTAIQQASDLINELVATDPSLDGMGSTACAVMFDGEKMVLANIGDSRAYRYREGELTRLSKDHSWVQSLIDEGRITESEALEHPHRSLILKVVNGQPQHKPDLIAVEVAAGDRLMLCSDGLCGMVTDDVIAARLDGERSDVMASLIRLAHLEGGQDNITIVVADVVVGEPEGEPQSFGAAALIDLADVDAEHTLTDGRAAARRSTTPDDKEQVRYAPTTKRRRWGWAKVMLAVVLPLLVVGSGAGLWYSYTQQQYYVGASQDRLGIFQGVPDPVFGLPLSHIVETDDTLISDLPPYYQEQVQDTISSPSLESARQTVAMLQTKAAECVQQRQSWHSAPPTPPTRPASPGTKSPNGTIPASPSPTPAINAEC